MTLDNNTTHLYCFHNAGDWAFVNNKSFSEEGGVPLKRYARIIVTVHFVSCFLTSNSLICTSDSLLCRALYKSCTAVFTDTYNIISPFVLERAASFFQELTDKTL